MKEWLEERIEALIGSILLPLLFVGIPTFAGRSWDETVRNGELLILSAGVCTASFIQMLFCLIRARRGLPTVLHMCSVFVLLLYAVLRYAVRVDEKTIQVLDGDDIRQSTFLFVTVSVLMLLQPAVSPKSHAKKYSYFGKQKP